MNSRIVSALLMGILFALYVHYYYLKWNLRGRDAFLVYQAHRFDRYMASPRPLFGQIITYTIVIVLFLGAYELLVFLLSKIIKPDLQAASNPSAAAAKINS